MPSVFLLESETLISLNTSTNFDQSSLKDDEYLVYEALQQQSSLKVDEINAIIDTKNSFPLLQRLLDLKAIVVEQEVLEKYTPKLIRCVRIHSDHQHDDALQELLKSLTRSAKQREIVLNYFALAPRHPQIKVSELKTKSNATSTQIKALIDKNIFEEYFFQTDRIQFDASETSASKSLNEFQESALQEIDTSFETYDISLLHGVTSSGKTEIYVKKIEAIIAARKTSSLFSS